MAIDPLTQYSNFLQNPTSVNQIGMVTADPANYLTNQFFQLPEYQLLYGQQAGQGATPNYNPMDPTQRFQFNPGYQFAIQQGNKQLQQYGAARGLLESGAMQRQLANYNQGMADQNYQQWLGQQQSLFSDYQNRLQGLAGMGQQTATNTSNQNAQLAGLLSGLYSNMGQNQAQAALGTGSNISSLLGNQGVFGGSGYINTAAAQSNNLMQAAALQAQIAMANQASQNAQSAGAMGGIGSLISGVGSLLGSFF